MPGDQLASLHQHWVILVECVLQDAEAVARDAYVDAAATGGMPIAHRRQPRVAQRLRQRGFNQASWLARAVARDIGGELVEGLLVRTRATSSQTELDAHGRRANVRGAFAVKGSLRGRDVVLVDELFYGIREREALDSTVVELDVLFFQSVECFDASAMTTAQCQDPGLVEF